ncbi:LysM peptidoglycan-binding domain-containing protein [Bacteroides sp. 214]|uniref:peptidoglycan DD-metalloendopeptidase family protein n=1 Tax=Bacteroides sp. 214 TaxID=2302935 RepID=UPI0013D41C68|nr:peptidoglycan DD-metalloendopeptidase family protein [Bacteroides sp. 214]NDW12312.1 LysM peptidoglycan-binding domain-containing protein [Bacteroides sp. 214]
MSFTGMKIWLSAVAILLSANAFSQDLIARQAPVDRKLKSVDSLLIQKQLKLEETYPYPAFDLYPDWNKTSVHNYAGVKLPLEHQIDLTGFCMPTTNTRITSKFGPRRRRMHNGIDVKVQVGDSIYAAFDGKVRIVRNQGRRVGYGLYVVIRHNNGLETVYGHLSKQLVKEDDYVKAGELIGLGGNTGRSTGSHLHFETRFLGVAINPALIFDFTKQDIVADNFTFRSRKGSTSSSTTLVADGDGVIRYHKVRSGDTLSRIASQRGVSIDTLCELNRITRKTILRPGQVLRCS